MITLEELKEKTGYDSFLKFKRQCKGSSNSLKSLELIRYYYDKGKVVELDIKPEELFMLADGEIAKRRKDKKAMAP